LRISKNARASRISLALLALACSLGALAAGPPPRSVFIEELTWPEVRAAIDGGASTAIVYAGSTEQNGPHLVTGKHNLVARHVAARIAQRLANALVYPILPYAPTGDARAKTGHMRFPGSVSLVTPTYVAVVRDVAESARAAGFRSVLIMADHGDGQDALAALAKELDEAWAPTGTRVFHIGELYAKTLEKEAAWLRARGLEPGGHGGLADTAVLMAIDADRRGGTGGGSSGRAVRRDKFGHTSPDTGVEGNPRGATAAIGRALIELKVEAALDQIRRLVPATGSTPPAAR
jgi:creatinine amidohydrolase